MSTTWWRQARDRDGRTIVERLELTARKSFYQLEEMRPYRQRIRSIIRRLNRCVQCHGTGKVPELEERGGPWMEYNVLVWEECPACGGTGRVKEER